VVGTGDDRVFFNNPLTRTSVWERPEDLVNRSDVDELLCGPPDPEVQNVVPSENNMTPNAGKKRPVTSEDEAAPAKKAKTLKTVKNEKIIGI